MSAAPAGFEHRVLVLAPVGRDAELLQRMLASDGAQSERCADLPALVHELERGAAAVLIAEEALGVDHEPLTAYVGRQPPWSDLPVLLLTRRGADSAAAGQAVARLGNVTLLERPVRVAALGSAVRTALRARRRQYQTRAHLLEREEADRRKDEFLATLAHELRNPLAPIRNSVNLLRLSGAAQPGAQLWEMMERQVGHMVRLVDDLLEVSRITRGKITLRKQRVEVAEVVSAAIETSRPFIDAGRHELTVVPAAEPLAVDADPVRLAQVLSNLLNNAAKFTADGGRITITARRDDASVVVAIRDTGAGIAAEALPRIFDMFMQADAGAHGQGGLGIGLTLARTLVDLHGGNIRASSDGRGKGSEFVVRLPLAEGVPAAAASPHEPATARMPGPRVLVVDDNHDAADSMGALLQMLGADSRVVYDGEAALTAFADYRPAIVLLDLGMPAMDGYEVARRIRRRPDGESTALIALTGWGQEKDRKLARAAGFDKHLIKPADIGALQAVLAAPVRS